MGRIGTGAEERRIRATWPRARGRSTPAPAPRRGTCDARGAGRIIPSLIADENEPIPALPQETR